MRGRKAFLRDFCAREPMQGFRRQDDERREEAAGYDGGGNALGLPLGAGGATFVTWGLLAVNLAVWALMELSGGSDRTLVLVRFGAMYGPLIAMGEYWRLFTAVFLHAGVLHLLLNCIGLWIIGRLVEGLYGRFRFITMYLIAGLSGSALSYVFNKAVAVGASGAIFGILGALTAYFLAHRDLMGDMGRQNLTGLAVVVALNLAVGLIIPGIDNWAHLGGLAGGFAVGLALAPRYRYETVVTPFGVGRRIAGERSPGMRWLIVGVALAAIVGLVRLGDALP